MLAMWKITDILFMAAIIATQDMQGSKVLSDETAGLYERAVTGLMKHNMLLYFAYADFEEVN